MHIPCMYMTVLCMFPSVLYVPVCIVCTCPIGSNILYYVLIVVSWCKQVILDMYA